MPHGAPDWYRLRPRDITHTLGDIGEIAPRLGSIVTFDRRGSVVLLDDMEDGVAKWLDTPLGVNTTYERSLATARNGAYSMLLYLGTTVGTNREIVRRTAPFRGIGSFGFEASVFKANELNRFDINLNVSTGTDEYYMAARIRGAGEVGYLDSTGTFVPLLTGLSWLAPWEGFDTLKIVADFVTGNYVRLLFNNRVLPIPNIPMRHTTLGLGPHTLITMTAEILATGPLSIYVDDVIVTSDEP